MALGVLTREAIERAIAEYDDLGRDAFLAKYGFGRATTYALVVDGVEYDPKAIAGVAYGIDHPERGPLANTEFNGGLALRGAYRPAGFDVVLRTTPGKVVLRDLLEQLMTEYPQAKASAFSGSHPVQDVLRSLVESLKRTGSVASRPSVQVRGSAGQGNWAAIPWVAFLDDRVTTSTQSGVYPVLLFREDLSGFYLTVAQGVTKLREQGRAHMLAELEAAATRVRGLADQSVAERAFKADSHIDLKSNAPLARDYTASTIVHKFYARGEVPEDAELERDLDVALGLSDDDIDQRSSEAARPAPGNRLLAAAEAFRRAVDESGLIVPTGHGDRVVALMAALVTKPFVILSGMSGSGKTQLAQRLGEWFGEGPHGRRFLPVAVRPDWTGPEALFGYEDALRSSQEGKAAWFVPNTLAFLLAAAQDPEMPYLLLLDEMNLAHVERYFSDFLSGIESRDAILPNLVRGSDGEWRIQESDPLIPLPRNVFVIGTVNVDETTYQFSPKVLDRATTFEVRTKTEELLDQVQRPVAIGSASTAHLQSLVALVLDDTWQLDADGDRDVAKALRDLHERLAESDDEFGHRVFYEGRRLAAALGQLGIRDRNAVLDHIVLLKVLPKIHGSRRRAEPVLKRLAAFAADPEGPHEISLEQGNLAALPMTMSKVRRMLNAVAIHQFVSFTD